MRVNNMKLMRATIYGFAKWHDFQIDFHPRDLQVIYGENESGKSSIQQFILFMLFGLPPKKRAFFRSKTSGKMGGMLTVYDEAIGEFTVERLDEVRNGAAKCLLPNGEEADEQWLKGRLNGMTRQTYQSIFSFDALDLSALKTMNEKDLGEILLGIGLTGSTDIYAVEKRLDSKISELFKPFGKKPIINQQLDYLDDLTSRMQTFKSQEKTYSKKKVELAEITTEIESLHHTILVEKKNVSEYEKLQQALPNLMRLSKYQNLLESYPEAITFPEDGVNRWRAIKEKILPLESELAIFKKSATSYSTKQKELDESLMDLQTYEKIKHLLDTQTLYNEHVREIKSLEKTIKESKIELRNEIRNIDTKLEISGLTDMALTYQTENTWIQLYKETQQLDIEKEKLNQEDAIQRKQKQELESSLDSLKENRLTSKQVDELSNRIHDFNNYQYQESENKRKSNIEVFKKQKQKTSVTLFWGSLFIGILFGLIGLVQGYIWCYGVMLVSLGLGIVQWIISNQSINMMEQLLNKSSANVVNLSVTVEEKEEAEELLAIHDECMRKTATVEEKIQANKIEQIKWRERYELIMDKSKRIDDKIMEQRKRYPILETIDVSNWPSFYHTFKSLLRQNHEWINKSKELNDVKEEESQYRERVMKFFTDKNWELNYKSMDACFAFLQEKVEEHENTLRLLDQYDTWIQTTNGQMDNTKQKHEVFQQELTNLLNVAEVENEERFYQKNTTLEEKKELVKKIEEVMEQLDSIFPRDKTEDLASNNITNVTELEELLEEHEKKVELAEKGLEEKRERLAAINADLANMESSDEYSQIMHRFYLESAELTKFVEKWAVLKSAKEMLLETKNNYRDKYMSRIMEQTSDYFAILTNHTYTSVYAPTDKQVLQVESTNKLRYTIDELSQGTKDQLYISLRLAISEVMSDTHYLPFIIDDAFVHFDDSRVEQMMNLIASIAKKRQVILFTCKRSHINDVHANEITVLSESVRNN